MGSPVNADSPVETLEKLSEIIIEVMRGLSANRQTLSAGLLSKALAERQDVSDILTPPRPSGTSENHAHSSIIADQNSQETLELRNQLQILQTQKDRLLGQMAALEEQGARAQDFHKRAFNTLLTLIPAPQNEALAVSLEQLRRSLLAGADMGLLEGSLRDLKDTILREGRDEKKTGERETGFLGRWWKRVGPSDGEGSSKDVHAKKLRDVFLDIFAELQLDLGKEYVDRFSRVHERIRETHDLDQLLVLAGDVLDVIQHCTRFIHEERTQVADFCTEIGANLAEMESHFLASMRHSSEARLANTSFDRNLDLHMEEIKQSADFSKSLGEFKGLVVSRLTTIKGALEKKRQEDELRFEEVNREMNILQEKLQSTKREIEQVQERTKALEKETLADPLTGIHNLRAYKARLKEELQRYRRYHQAFSLVMFDVDHFKLVNDQYGHYAGDKCLKEIIKRIKPTLRESDFLARYGGEEFIVILPGTSEESALQVGERLCNAIEKTRFLYQGEEIPLTISVGVTQVKPSDTYEETLFNRVDAAVYEAKRTGRNRAVLR